jgi:hypothetical protein
MKEKRKGMERRDAHDGRPAGRREGHNVPSGHKRNPSTGAFVKHRDAHQSDRRLRGNMYGRRVRQRRGGRWHAQRTAERRSKQTMAKLLRQGSVTVYEERTAKADRRRADRREQAA